LPLIPWFSLSWDRELSIGSIMPSRVAALFFKVCEALLPLIG